MKIQVSNTGPLIKLDGEEVEFPNDKILVVMESTRGNGMVIILETDEAARLGHRLLKLAADRYANKMDVKSKGMGI